MGVERTSKQVVAGFGYNPLIAWGSFTPVNGAAPTVTNDYGLIFARTGEGVWTATLRERPTLGWAPVVQPVYSGTDYYETRISAAVQATGVITITHKFCTYATIVSAGPVADDVSGLSQVYVFVYGIRG